MRTRRAVAASIVAVFESRRDPRERVIALRQDMAVARNKIREVLQELADRQAIAPKDVTYAMEGYADDLLSDLVYTIERDLQHEIERESPA